MKMLSPSGTLRLVTGIFAQQFPAHDLHFLETIFHEVHRLFDGRYPGYQASDSEYHDHIHTCVATVAAARILDGHMKRGGAPKLTVRDFELAIAAILLHDTGYIKKTGDTDGTGAKYTLMHANRSVDFAGVVLPRLGLTPDEVRTVQFAILFAGNENWNDPAGLTEQRRFIGCVVGAGDMLGQMAAPDYPERLPDLYREFSEAANFSKLKNTGIAIYRSADDLMRRTREFYDGYVHKMLTTRWGNVHEVARFHFPDQQDHYREAIAINLDRIDQLVRR